MGSFYATTSKTDCLQNCINLAKTEFPYRI